jgi:hypothetical protein
MAKQFKAQHASGSGPWTGKAVNVIDIEPLVASLQVTDTTLRVLSLSESGLILNEAEGDLHDVKEMDNLYSHGFKSSVLHHLSTSPTVSAIPEYPQQVPSPKVTSLPDDGPEVHFILKHNRTDTVLAHVDTGATVMVSNVMGEIHGAVPTNARCGTAMTGSKATIDTLGTWMIDLVGSKARKDLPLALRGTTQITGFQQRSLSLHALKELGFDCAHVLTQEGNLLKITMDGEEHVFPLLMINGGDYVKMRIHSPPPAAGGILRFCHLYLSLQ